MFPALLAAIPALMSLFSSAAGGAAAAGTAGAATAGAAGAGAAGGAAGGLGGLLGGLFGGASGGAAAGGGATTAAEALPELAGAGSSGGFLGGAPAAGAPSGGMGGIFGNLLGSMGGGGQQGGGGGGNMMQDLLGGPGRAYMVGAQAGKGDFKGAQQMMDQHTAAVNQTNRTGLLANEDARRQEAFQMDKDKQAKADAANLQIQKIFEDPKALDNLTETLPKVLGPLLATGNHQGAHDILNFITKAATDKTENSAALAAGDIVRGSRKDDGSFDWQAAEDKLAALGNPHAVKAFNALRPSLAAEGTAANQKDLAVSREANRAHQLENERIANQNSARGEAALNESMRHNRVTEDRLATGMNMRQGLGPVPPKQLTEYINKNGANPQQDPVLSSQPSVTHGDLVQSGYNRVPQAVQTQLKQSNIALTQLNRLEGMTDELFKDVKPGMNLLNAAKLKGQEALATGKVREFQTLLLETIPSMAVASGLTPGRVGEAVLERIEKPMMPNLSDSQESAKGKLKQLKLRLENNRDMFFGQGAKLEGGGGGGAAPSKAEIDAAKKRLGIQ